MVGTQGASRAWRPHRANARTVSAILAREVAFDPEHTFVYRHNAYHSSGAISLFLVSTRERLGNRHPTDR